MVPGSRRAWVTFAVDEKGAKEAITLSKSLRKVVTGADIVVLASFEVFRQMGETFASYFDVVLPQFMMKRNNFTELDLLKVMACNLHMYSKCVILHPNKLVIKNCDDIFNLEEQFAATSISNDPNKLDYSLFVLSPSVSFFASIVSKVESGKFSTLSEVFDDLLQGKADDGSKESAFFHMLPQSNNYTICKSSLSFRHGIHEATIIGYEDMDFLKNNLKVIPFSKDDLYEPQTKDQLSDTVSKNNSKSYYKDSIAVVGHSCRFPEANNSEEFWELMNSGGDGIRQVPMERLFDFQKNDSRFMVSKAGFLKCPIDEFDAKFFGISPREATFMDPQQRLLLEVAWEALENSAINPHSLKNSNTGVFTGVWTHDYERLVVENASAQDFHHVILGNAFSATSARVSYFLGLNGPNIAVESGCSSSMVGLHLACDSLKKGETDLSLVLGANILVVNLPYSEIPILANDGHCKTFDEKADGFGRAEGVAVIVLKRLSDAIKSGDRIMGIIRGSALSNEGTTSSFGTPSKHCQEIAVKEAIKNASIDPNDVDYVEAHGTGTPVGDPIEFAALAAAYSSSGRKNPLVVGSGKTNIGHTESVAGLAGVLKVLLSMQHEIIPPHRNFDTLNPNIDLNTIPSIIPTEPQKWERSSERIRRAGVSSFGISGTNVHAILEEPPYWGFNDVNKCVLSNEYHYILPISAKSENGLNDLCKIYVEYFKENSEVNLGDVTFTAATGRAHFKHRAAFVGGSVEEIVTSLQKDVFNTSAKILKADKPKIAFLFTGQGSQYVGMGKDLYQSNIVFRSAFDECEMHLENHDISLKAALWSEESNNLLEQTIYSQLSIFAIEYSLFKLWHSFGITPDFVLGHSVGEFAASVAAGILNLHDALCLIVERSRLIESLPLGGMLAIKASNKDVQIMISEFSLINSDSWIDIAVINSSEETVVAGNRDAIILFEDFCRIRNTKMHTIAAAHAFHSRAVDIIEKEFHDFGKSISYKIPIPGVNYVSGTTGKLIETGDIDSSYWCRHVRNTVNFEEGMKTLFENGCNVFLEIGSHPVLLPLGMSNDSFVNESIWLPSLRKKTDCWSTLLDGLAKLYTNGVEINWKSLHLAKGRKKLELPTYPFQRQKYWTNINMEDFAPNVHPFLGKELPLADQANHVYQNSLKLNDFPYLKDHKVANITILPGAAFLEMILSAGNHVLCKNNLSTLSVENFLIDAPFELASENHYKMQVVASPITQEDNNNKIAVKVFSFQHLNGYNDEKTWKRYAEATVDVDDGEFGRNSKEDTEKFEDIKQRCENEYKAEEAYKQISEIGINFGESFQSIQTVWKGDNEALAEIPAPKDNNAQGYIFHPIVLDAMFQIFGLSIDKENVNLHLPVTVEKFTLFSKKKTQLFFAHAVWGNEVSSGKVSLYNENNVLLAVMKGIRLVQTSVSAFLNVINSQRNNLPGMYQEVWRSRDGPLQSRIDLSEICLGDQKILEELKVVMKDKVEDLKELFPLYDRRFHVAVIIKLLLGFGWKPSIHTTFTCHAVMVEYGISMKIENLLSAFFQLLVEAGYLTKNTDTDELAVSANIPDLNEVERIIQEFNEVTREINTKRNKVHVGTHIANNCVTQFYDVAFEKTSPHNVLFGNEDPTLNALRLYTEGDEAGCANIRMTQYTRLLFKETCKTHSESILRILEVGAGSGATSKEIMQGLKISGISFRYSFTDISHHFINEAKNNLQDTDNLEFKVLDIEKDPLIQGFAPYHYDIVIASNVIHATAKLHDSIRNIRLLLKQGGILLLQEPLRPQLALDFIFGIMEDYWKFNDYDIRQNHPCASKEVWDKVFSQTGFNFSVNISEDFETLSVLVTQACSINNSTIMEFPMNTQSSTWILECDNDGYYGILKEMLNSIGRQVCLVKNLNDSEIQGQNSENCFYLNYSAENEIENCINSIFEHYNVEGCCLLRGISDYDCDDQKSICHSPLRFMKQILSKGAAKLRLYVVTSGIYNVGNQKTMHPHKATLAGLLKSASNEAAHLPAKLIEIDPDNIKSSLNANAAEIFYELFSGDDGICCYRKNRKFVMRLCSMGKSNSVLTLPQGRYTVVIPSSKKVADLHFKYTTKGSLKPNEVEVLVKATALNFRDLLVILKPEMYHTQFESIGSDFSGVITDVGSLVKQYKVGDQVFGISQNSCAASHVVINENLIQIKPEIFTFSEACTIPSVFLTAYLCLVTTANLQKDETVLIHVASGGVGLVAVQIAKYLGAKIIATAGSHRKRTYLKSLGIENVFHSRDITFEKEINRVTEGKGVDVVLNSLTGPGFKESTLRSCGQNARFVEIGKVNIWRPEEVLEFRSDVSYTIIDLETVDEVVTKKLVDAMKHCISNDKLIPLPFSRFPITQIKDALNYFAKAEHIGKIVLTMPDFKETDRISSELTFSDQATYLVTGGLHGIGLEVAKWLVVCGAKNIILVARSPPDENALQVLKKLRGQGCRVAPMLADVGDLKQCTMLFDTIKSQTEKWPPLKGIIHSAGVISDATISNQTWEKFDEVFNAKVRGGWNLHNLSKDLFLEHFVVFSSVAGVFGTPGQSNHSAANMFLDSLIHYRYTIGLPGQTVNWGVWAEIGRHAAEKERNHDFATSFGFMTFSPAQGIAALKHVMARPNLRQVAVVQVDVPLVVETYGDRGGFLSELINAQDEDTTAVSNANSETFWNEINPLNLPERVAYIKKYLEKIIRKTLRLPESEQLDEFQNFSEMGLDSLMAVEMKNKMQNVIGKKLALTATSLLDHPTIHKLSNYLAEQTLTIKTSETENETSALEDQTQLIQQDSILPAEIKGLDSFNGKDSGIKTILLTGASGRFGMYVLKDLLEKTSVLVVCLLRGKNIEQAHQKLLANLKKFKLDTFVDMDNFSIIIGNIAEKNLGLSQEIYDSLSSQIDCVIHLAIKANHVEKYTKSKTGVADIRSVNVLGTINILRFCCNIKTKRVFYSSNYIAANRFTEDGFLYEDFPDEENIADNLFWGYVITKFVCEKLLRQANERGIPCTVVRYLELTGDSETGVFSIGNNSFMNFLLLSVRHKVVPNIEGGWSFMPVDVASKLAIKLLFSKNAKPGVYNMTPNILFRSNDFVEALSEFGYESTVVSPDEFERVIMNSKENDPWVSIFIDSYGSDIKTAIYQASALGKMVKDKNLLYHISEKLLKAVPDINQALPDYKTVVRKYLQYAQASGISKDVPNSNTQ